VLDKDANVSREEVMQARVLGNHPENGKPVSVRMGRYGPFVQCGTKDDEEKPKIASLLPGQKMDSVTLDDAMVLFQLPRDLGETPEGEKMSTNFGRFGPYVKYGSKFVSLPKDEDINPYTITTERALKLVADKKQADLDRIIASWEEEGIQILKGRWGPYITDGNKNAKMPSKDYDPTTLTLEECQELLEKAPERKGRGKKKAGKKAAPKEKKLTPKQEEAKKKREEKAKAKQAEKARLRRNMLARKRRAKLKKEKEKTAKSEAAAKKKIADAKRKKAAKKKSGS
jgi:DNA topoisomerase-1